MINYNLQLLICLILHFFGLILTQQMTLIQLQSQQLIIPCLHRHRGVWILLNLCKFLIHYLLICLFLLHIVLQMIIYRIKLRLQHRQFLTTGLGLRHSHLLEDLPR
uniref:Uncharacterized protein n=1 Tax=Opuntia streptacantha TaxID=393608 RepID=A0A7C9DYQ5_OPUST